MSESKVGSLGIIIVAFVICIAGSAGATYFLVGQIKQSEIDNHKSQYETQISGLNSQVDNLQNILNVDNPNYINQMIKGLQSREEANYWYGAAVANEILAESYYDGNEFYWASYYAVLAELEYESTAENFSLAKSYFEDALDHAPNNKTHQLTQLYITLSDYEFQMVDICKDENHDYSSACDYYDQGEWGLGDIKIEDMNDHIEDYNDLLDPKNECQSDIDFLLENFLI